MKDSVINKGNHQTMRLAPKIQQAQGEAEGGRFAGSAMTPAPGITFRQTAHFFSLDTLISVSCSFVGLREGGPSRHWQLPFF